ncbi:CHAT domain-containing protein, partial [Planktothrix sp. FACHB-1355]
NDRLGFIGTLTNIGTIYYELGEEQKALITFDLAIFESIGNKNTPLYAMNLVNIAAIYKDRNEPQKALGYLKQALPIVRETGNQSWLATTINNIGTIYDDISQPLQALDYYKQALSIYQEIREPLGIAITLNNMGEVYGSIKQFEDALACFKQALQTLRQMQGGWPKLEGAILSNIGTVYQDTGQPMQAISNWEQSTSITIGIRRGLQKKNRRNFLEANSQTPIALISLLIDVNQLDRAFEWANLATTADLADYTRLINAKVSHPQAQQKIDEWNQKNQQLQFIQRRLQDNFSEQISRQMRELESQVLADADKISKEFPEIAELFETTLTDIEKLRSSIPAGTVVIQPVLLTDVKNVPNTVAIFIVTKDQLSVIKNPIDPTEFDKLLTEYREQLQNFDDKYIETSAGIYNIIIRPLEDKIKVLSPKQLSIIATGKLRYIPFETLFDEQTDQYLIQKYPINYLTRLSSRSLNSNRETVARNSLQKGVLALGNPIPRDPQNLPGTEEEVRNIAQLFPGSESFLHNNATLDKFKTSAPRFPFLHLATHGCFQPEGCQKLGMEANTLLFADKQLNIADAALLGLQNTELLTLSACQTALQANSNGEEIAGLAYIFERAGAKAVMASLWNAEDNTTKEIMIEFYQNIKNGMSKGEALQKAKLSQIDKHHPYYWSPFILIGDAR